ncbi:Transcriptional regulator containing PAS, AAA-type ATPase, and DNA-binding Fis domains [Pelosinus propionicus DSM 13327]|uniref:Transcriptional regulator containing PAS, AAA-type ATPase, and DNA-binding Fis domains n=2 Tax=Pelosinus TaxID=365348 RepID=A0A1I4NUL1_9FIRM|nr:Transcriptional regulator containing PAS, AAA-type ATPase, and DNA-binding Fis domains [Pelosinus propionicus DSM 13327]
MEKKSLVNSIKDMATRSSRLRITSRNTLVKNMFQFLRSQTDLQCELLLLCTEHGLILDFSTLDLDCDISGYTVPVDALYAHQDRLLFHDNLKGYIIISLNQQKLVPIINHLQSDIDALLKMFDASERHNQDLLNCLDSVRNAISIYDKDANLLFANNKFCTDLHIDDRDAVIGMNIHDVINHAGIKIHPMENNSSQLKMLDVLKYGEEVLDWEVRIESQATPNVAQIVSNDMYPVINKNGEVEGMVELTHSRHQDMKRAKKIVGLSAEYSFDDIIGSSPAIREKIKQAKNFANSPFNFLITGESGVGKELFAQSIHNYSAMKKGPFVALNCANFSEGLIESELFGYVGGAFTGASKTGQMGKFELADKGTLFLDEIGELPYHFQSKLLRVLETWAVTRIGSSRQIPVNVRLIAATNRDLEKMVSEGLFREDLYYRLQVLSIEIPPLRERREDLLLLAETFLKQSMNPNSGALKTLDADAQKALLEYDWKGNVRELRNVINRVTILSKTNVITRDILEASIHSKGYMLKHSTSEAPEDRLNKRRMEVDASYANLLREVLDITHGNKKQAAELLGVSRKTFYRMLEKYNGCC